MQTAPPQDGGVQLALTVLGPNSASGLRDMNVAVKHNFPIKWILRIDFVRVSGKSEAIATHLQQ